MAYILNIVYCSQFKYIVSRVYQICRSILLLYYYQQYQGKQMSSFVSFQTKSNAGPDHRLSFFLLDLLFTIIFTFYLILKQTSTYMLP